MRKFIIGAVTVALAIVAGFGPAASAATITPTPVAVKHAPAGYFYQVDWIWANGRIGDADGPFTYNTQAKADAIGGKPNHPGMIARIVLSTLSD